MSEITIYFTTSENCRKYSSRYCVNPTELEIKERIPKKGLKKQIIIIKNKITKHRYIIVSPQIDLDKYDKINFVSPIWNNKLATPVEQFIYANIDVLNKKQVSIIAISASGSDKVKEQYQNNFTVANFTSVANSQI